MADARALLNDSLSQRLEHHFQRHPALEQLEEAEAIRLGHEAADAVLGPVIWRELLGEDRLDTTKVTLLLGITRQALHKRLKNHDLLGVPGRATTWFPAWQFDLPRRQVRPIVTALLEPWTADGGTGWDELAVLSWSTSPQPELGGETPEQWVGAGKHDQPVVDAARRAAKAFLG